MAEETLIVGFHAVGARLRQDSSSVVEVFVDGGRRDGRMRDLLRQLDQTGVRTVTLDARQLSRMAGSDSHQGVVARAVTRSERRTLEELLEDLEEAPLLLVLDGVQDPHNLGACLRVADGAGVHAVIAPKDRACGLTATAIKVASGAAESVPYFSVTNLARTLRDLKDRGVWIVGAAGEAEKDLYSSSLRGPLAWVLGAEGEGLRRLTREHCDELIRIPMAGAVESLNVSTAAAVCLFEARRQRHS